MSIGRATEDADGSRRVHGYYSRGSSLVGSVLTRVPVNETGRGTEKRGRKGEFDRTFAKQVLDALAK
jgi:hypothetical protein